MSTPKHRSALARLGEERSLLRTLSRLIASDVDEARDDGASDRELCLALGLDPELAEHRLAEELSVLCGWAT